MRLTVDLELDDLADAGADAVVGLAQVVALAVLLDVLQQQRAVVQEPRVHPLPDLLVLARLASCNTRHTTHVRSSHQNPVKTFSCAYLLNCGASLSLLCIEKV